MFPISSGWTCTDLYLAGKATTDQKFCPPCSELINDVILETNPPFDEHQVFEHRRDAYVDTFYPNLKPNELQVLHQKVLKAEQEAKVFEFEPCSTEYHDRLMKAQTELKEAETAYHQARQANATARQKQLRCDYVRSRWGDDKTVKQFLFELSSLCLEPSRLKSLTFCINGYSGDVSFGINAKDAKGHEQLQWFPNIYREIFKNFDPNTPFHAFCSFRGKYIAVEMTWLGAIRCTPSLTKGGEADFQRSTRTNAQNEVSMAISLKSMARFEILKAKHHSVFQQAAKLTHALDSNDYGRYVYYPTLSRHAAHLQLATRDGHYDRFELEVDFQTALLMSQLDNNFPSTSSSLDNTEQQKATQSNTDQIKTEQYDFPIMEEFQEKSNGKDKGKANMSGKGKAKGKNKNKSLVDNQSHERQDHPRKQAIEKRKLDDTPSFEDEDQMILAQIHSTKPQKPFAETNAKFLTMIKISNEPLIFPPLIVKNGTFEEFSRQWSRTLGMPPQQKTYYRRSLTKYFKPTLQTDTALDSCLFRFSAYSIYDF